MRELPLLLLTACLSCAGLRAQNTAVPETVPAAPASASDAPLPDINTLMHQVQANERLAEAVEKNYIYREINRFDKLDGAGATTKTETREMEVFWLNGVRVTRMLKKDGKELTPEEKKKEDERIDKEVAKAGERKSKAGERGHETDSAGHDEITFSRMLELGTFSKPRREQVQGRPAIAVDYTGDPRAKTHNMGEAVFHELAGTIWVDEQDRFISRLEGHFANNLKIGGGMLVNIRQGTKFQANFAKINNEVWLPQTMEGSGHVRYLLFFALDGSFHGQTSDYRRFKATSTISPVLGEVTPDEPGSPEQAAAPKP